MKTDRELLELAAKAAGKYAPKKDRPKGWEGIRPETFGCFTMGGEGATPDYQWNPLQDDGDALRLAVKLKIRIGFRPCAYADTPSGVRFFGAHECDDADARTRRAITRAAAQIQEEKEIEK